MTGARGGGPTDISLVDSCCTNINIRLVAKEIAADALIKGPFRSLIDICLTAKQKKGCTNNNTLKVKFFTGNTIVRLTTTFLLLEKNIH